jgi:hypothetical protein
MAKQYVAIDLLALLLPNDVYVKLKSPRPPEEVLVHIREAVKTMSARQKKAALANAEAMAVYANALKKELRR